MRVGYSAGQATALLVLGGLQIILGTFATGSVPIGTGLVFVMFGCLMMFRQLLEFDPVTRTIAVKAQIVPWVRRFPGAAGGRLEVAANRIVWVRPDGSRKKVPVRRSAANSDEWDAVLAQLGATPR